VAVFSVGRLISAPLLGWLSGRYISNTRLLSACLALCVIGNFFYGLGLELGLVSIVLSRLVLGFATGILGVARAFVSLVTSTEERTGYMSLLNAVQFVGFSLTPFLGSVLCGINFSILGVQINCFSAPGFLLCMINVVMLVLFLILFRETKKEVSSSSSTNDDPARISHDELESNWLSTWLGPAIFILLNAVVRGSISVLETVGGGMFRETWKDDDGDELEDTGYFFTGIGCIGLVSYIVVTLLSKRVSDYIMLIFGLLCIVVGSSLFIGITDENFYRFVGGCVLIWSCGMPLTGTCVVSMCSKTITPSQQGTVMGLLTAAGSIGRIAGPLIAALPRTYCFVSVFLMVSFSLVISIVLRKRLTGIVR
jgi:MFS family permease